MVEGPSGTQFTPVQGVGPLAPGEGLSGKAPPGTLAEFADWTHVPRLMSDHLRHLVMVAYGSVDIYEKNEMAFLGVLSHAASNAGISSLNIVAGSILVIGVLPNLASKMTLLCQYKKRLETAEKMVIDIGNALKKAKSDLKELPADDEKYDEKHKHLLNMILFLGRELDQATAARNALKESRFRLVSAANNGIEVAAGAVRIAKNAGALGGQMSAGTLSSLGTAVPALGIATGAFWTIYGGVMTVRSTKAYLKVNGELKQTQAELFIGFELDSETAKRLEDFKKKHPAEFKTDKELSAALKEEHKAALAAATAPSDGRQKSESPQMAPRPRPLTVEEYRAYEKAKAEGEKAASSKLNSSIFEKCRTLKRAILEKKRQFFTLERRKQICKICHFALLTAVGILGIAAGAVAIAASGGAATPFVLLGLFGLMVIVGGGILGTDVLGGMFEKQKKKEGEIGLTPQDKQSTGIRRVEDLGPLAQEIFQSSSDAAVRAQYLRSMGVGEEDKDPFGKCKEYAQSEAGIVEALTHHLGLLFLKEPGEEMRHLFSSLGIEHVSSAEELADDILELDEKIRNKLFETLKIDPKKVRGPETGSIDKAKLAKILDKRFSELFPKEEKLRKKLYDSGVTRLTTPEGLAEYIAGISLKDRLALLEVLGIKGKDIIDTSTGSSKISETKLSETLRTRFGYLFTNSDSVLDLFDEYGIKDFKAPGELAARVFEIKPDRARKFLLRRLGINPETAGRTEGHLAEIFQKEFAYLFPDEVRTELDFRRISGWGSPQGLVSMIQKKDLVVRKALLQKLGIDPSLESQVGGLADILRVRFPYLFG